MYKFKQAFGGVWCKSSSTLWNFWDKNSGNVSYSISIVSGYPYDVLPAFVDHDINDNFYDYAQSNFPIGPDINWSGLPWNKVNALNYELPSEMYNQLKITLRKDGSGNTPYLNGIYLEEGIKMDQIEPGEYRDMYLRTIIPSESYLGSYNSNLKVRWRVPV